MNARHLHGLLWREWLLHQGELRWVFAAWLFGVWVFPINPLFFLLPFGVIAALLLAPSFGGADAQEGSEEFSFSLPPTRSQRYLVRLALGGGPLLAMLGIGVLAGLFNLPQHLWGLFFESSFTVPFRRLEPATIYLVAIAGPLAVFSECFAAGSSSREPGTHGFLWLRGLFVAGIIAIGATMLEQVAWHQVNGVILIPAWTLWSALRLLYSYRGYKWKEGVSGLPALVVSSRRGTWAILLVVLAAVLILAVMYLFAVGA